MQFATHIAAAVIVSAMLMPAWSHAEEVPAVNPMSGDAKSIRENEKVREVYFGTGKTFAKASTP